MAQISSLGAGSGLDLASLLDQLQASENTKLDTITAQQKVNSTKISAYGQISSALTKLQTAITGLGSTGAFKANKVAFTGSGVSATAASTATPGTYSIKVSSVAKAHAITTAGQASKTAAITGSGELSLLSGTGTPVKITIAEGSTLEQIASQINQSGAAVSASIVNVGGANPYRLSITAKNTGTEYAIQQSFTESTSGDLSTILGGFTTTNAASDAVIDVNGMTITSSSNKVTDALPGVTFNVTAAGDTQSLTITQDSDAVKTAIQNFVTAYNSYASSMKSLTSYDADSKKAGTLLGDSTVRSIQQKVTGEITTALAGAGAGDISLLNELGIKITVDGSLAIDDTKLSDALANKPEAVQKFFAGTGNLGSDGFAYRMNKSLDKILAFDGSLANASTGLTNRNKDLDKTYEQQESQINSLIARYKAQFTTLGSLVAQMNSTQSFLSNQSAQWAKSSS
ncbi:flagellar filament capping protein FliD [Pseudomonas aeruginosa]